MRTLLLYSVMAIVMLFFTSFSGIKKESANPVLTDHQKNLISYFREIALGTEYGEGQELIRRWHRPMKVYAGGNPTPALTAELISIVDELNSLITNDFEIEIVDSREKSNFFIFFGDSEEYSALYPADAKFARTNSGVFHFYWNRNNEITSGHVFINTTGTDEIEQRHVLREELTQSLGLPRDSSTYPESVFQQKWTTPTEFAAIDRELIALLYHPKMMTGIRRQQVEALLIEILLSENV